MTFAKLMLLFMIKEDRLFHATTVMSGFDRVYQPSLDSLVAAKLIELEPETEHIHATYVLTEAGAGLLDELSRQVGG